MSESGKKMQTYFIHSLRLESVKIGRSAQPHVRLKDIRTGNPDDLRMLGIIEGDKESEFHHRFREYRKKGTEWFSLGPQLIDFVKAEFGCVIRQKKPSNGKRRVVAESWGAIVHRAEELFKCGLRNTDHEEFFDVVYDKIYGRVGDNLFPNGEKLNDERIEELNEASDSGYWIIQNLEKWWPWVMGWNVKEGNWLDLYLLFKRPDLARMREELLRELAHLGDLSDDDDIDFVRLNVAFCWRTRLGSELVGEIAGPAIIADDVAICCRNSNLMAIGIDELLDFKVLGDLWYRQNGLPIPAEAKAMFGGAGVSAKKPRLPLANNQMRLFT